MLQEYTTEELIYEYLDKVERKSFEAERHEQESDKIEDKRVEENLDWAAEEERKELEALAREEEELQKQLMSNLGSYLKDLKEKLQKLGA